MTTRMRVPAADRRSAGSPAAPAAAPRHEFGPAGRRAPGRPLTAAVRTRMEAAFGADFTDVRVHEDDRAAAIGAAAFTRGSEIAFPPGVWDPSTPDGLQALGHELAHVLQQRAGRVAGSGVTEEPALEAEAQEAGERVSHGAPVAPVRSAPTAGSGDGAAGTAPAQPGRFGDLFKGLFRRGGEQGAEETPYQAIPPDLGRRQTMYQPITSPENAAVFDRFRTESPYQNIPTIAQLQAIHESPYQNIPTGLQGPPPLPGGPKPAVLPRPARRRG